MPDWRLTNQLTFLKNAKLIRKEYSPPSQSWDHDHCAFCWDKFVARPNDGVHEGYYAPETDDWICSNCFEDFKNLFNWEVIEK